MRRICPDCDAELVETAGAALTSEQARFRCHDCGTRWRAVDGETLVEDE